MDEACYVERVDIIADLLTLVSEYSVELPFQVALYEIAEKTVQLHAAMIGAGQAATSQATRFHAKVATVLLDDDVGCRFGGSEEAVFALVNWKLLTDAIREFRIIVVPTRVQLLHLDLIGAIAIDLVCTQVDEYGFAVVPSRRLKEIESSARVDVKIVKTSSRCEIVARLGRGVDNQIEAIFLKQLEDMRPLADIQFVMPKVRVGFDKTMLIPSRISAWTKEISPHVIIDAVHPPAQSAEKVDHLGADEAGRSGYQKSVH